MQYNGLEITSKFLCVTKTDWAIVPKFAIIINGNSFEYHKSAQWLTTQYHKLLKKCYFSQHGSEWIYHDLLKDKSPMLIEDGEVLVQLKHGTRYRVESVDTLLTKFNTLSMKLTDEDQLFALRHILQDALCSIEQSEEDFITDFGYDTNYATMKKGISIYNQCRETYFKLQLGPQQMYDLLDKLSEQGIE